MQSGLANVLSNIGREALRIVLPAWCSVCGGELGWRSRIASCCDACWRGLPRIDGAKCRSCAQPLPEGELCIACIRTPLPLGWCEAWGEYRGGLETLLHALKFDRQDFLGDVLGGLAAGTLRQRGDLAFDAVVPVPMSPVRERRRGYNQATLIANGVARGIGVPCDPSLLTRRRDGATQSTLPKRERAANVRRAFGASARVRSRAILLVDDICTTGETLRACAKALHAAGASKVCAVAVAKST